MGRGATHFLTVSVRYFVKRGWFRARIGVQVCLGYPRIEFGYPAGGVDRRNSKLVMLSGMGITCFRENMIVELARVGAWVHVRRAVSLK